MISILKDWIRNPFRFYFLVASFIIIPISCTWLMIGEGFWLWISDPISFHSWGFINVFGTAAFGGFLFTAVPEWTHYTKDLSKICLLSLIVWLLIILCAFIDTSISAIFASIFWLLFTLFSINLSIKAKDNRHINIIVLLIVLCFLNAFYAFEPSILIIKQLAHSYIIAVSLVIFRIGKALGSKALELSKLSHCNFVPNPFYRNISVICLYLYIVSNLAGENPMTIAWISLAIGLAIIGRLRDWHYFVLLKQPFVRWYYVTLLCIGIGYCWQGYTVLLGDGNTIYPFHLIMIGGFLMMVMQAFSIAGTVHSSLDLPYPNTSRISLFFILLATLSRAFAGIISNRWSLNYTFLAWYLPAICISLAFIIYIRVFARIYTKYPALAPSPIER
ncbi:NnrS family protein [Taylorella equigenitalis]|uniref:NnrS family protein n=1 Tax=Taylorella equigenitalis TaxID=29575 RepID=UPI000DD9AF8D|nr:NnrS family protein [Taylorella equigenitalis]RBA26455.1 NnrS family protein [Taylorella equigenitalis]